MCMYEEMMPSVRGELALTQSANALCRGLAVKAVAGRKPGRGRGRGRKGGRGRGSAANGSPHAHTNGAVDSSSDERDASGSDAD